MIIDLFKSKADQFNSFGFSCKGILVEKHNDNGLYVPNNREETSIIYGEDTIEEEMLGNKFKVPANSFFQVHTGLAEMLYSKVFF